MCKHLRIRRQQFPVCVPSLRQPPCPLVVIMHGGGALNSWACLYHLYLPLQWDGQARRFSHLGDLPALGSGEAVYRISGQRFQSRCAGPCGWAGDNTRSMLWPGR